MGEHVFVTMEERLEEIKTLIIRAALAPQERKPSQRWFAECIALYALLLAQANDDEEKSGRLTELAMAMWQTGYEAASKLEFVLPEGAQG